MITNLIKLNTELSAVRLEKDELAKKMSAEADKIKELEDKLAKVEESNKTLQTTIDSIKKDEAAVVLEVAESVNKKVVQSLASLGVKEGTVAEDVVATPTSTDPMAIYNKYEMLTGQDKINYFKENEKSIMKAMKAVHYVKVPVRSTSIINLGKE
jgi:hypothetical protein